MQANFNTNPYNKSDHENEMASEAHTSFKLRQAEDQISSNPGSMGQA